MPRFFCMPFACRSGVVESLDFSQKRLEEVPREVLKARKHIEELLLNVNSIDHLPPELFRCSKLRRLDVSENRIKALPPDICQLQMLADLNLSKNEIVEMPDEIGNCTSLTHLDVSTNIFPTLPKSIVNLSNLTVLNICNNPLTQLPQDIDRLQNLRFLDLGLCDLRALPPSIVRLANLRVLDLCDNSLTELPQYIDGLVSLEVLDLHGNQLNSLPEDILRCVSLKTLDLSGNHITMLPENFGDLVNLMEVTLCENLIGSLPSSIGRMKRLEILKASKNRLSELTPAICSCSQLTDLVLCENQLNDLPSSIGNLRLLKFLDVSVNNLQAIPSTIGGCASLSVLSLRHNQLQQLPMEVGRLEKLQVLDLIDNNLKYLPYTVTVLYKSKMTALWLSFNQPPLPTLSPIHEPVMNVKVLTCYLLPQRTAPIPDAPRNKSVIVGNRVYFHGETRPEEEQVTGGQLQRYDTPHPKPFAPKNRLQAMQQQNSGDPAAVGTSPEKPVEKNTTPERQQKDAVLSPPQSARSAGGEPHEMRPLRSVLKRPKSVISTISESDLVAGGQSGSARTFTIAVQRGSNGIEWSITGGLDSPPYKDRFGLFVSQLNDEGPAKSAGFRVGDRLISVNGRDLTILSHHDAVQLIKEAGERLEFVVERDPSVEGDENATNEPRALTQFERAAASLPLADAVSTVGTAISPPIQQNQKEQKIAAPPVSTLGANQQQNSSFTSSPPPQSAAPNSVAPGAGRSVTSPPSQNLGKRQQQLTQQNPTTKISVVRLQRNNQGVLGFSIKGEGGGSDAVRVSALSPGGAADGKIFVGDRLLAIGGVSVEHATHTEVVRMLAGSPNTVLELTVERALSPQTVPTHSGGMDALRASFITGGMVPQQQQQTAPQFRSTFPPHQPPLPPKKPRTFAAGNNNQQPPIMKPMQGPTTVGTTAFGEMTLWRSLPSLAAAEGDQTKPQPPPRPEKKRPAPQPPAAGTTTGDGRLMQNGGTTGGSPLRGSSSASNLLLMINGYGGSFRQPQQPANKVVPDIGYERPVAAEKVATPPPPPVRASSTSTEGAGSRISSPQTTFSATKEQQNGLPLAATPSPLPHQRQGTQSPPKPSGIPVPSSSSFGANSTTLGSSSGMEKSALTSSFSGSKLPVIAQHHPQQMPSVAPKPEIVPEKLAFSSKLQHFEKQISEQQQLAKGTRPPSSISSSNIANGRPSGIPMKKPLISQQDLEKMRAEAALSGSISGGGALQQQQPTTPVDEQRDQLSSLVSNNFSQLLETAAPNGNIIAGRNNNSAIGGSSSSSQSSIPVPTGAAHSPAASANGEISQGGPIRRGPSIIRTKNAEIWAERAAGVSPGSTPTPTENGEKANQDGALSRTSSSLSQRALDLEKRQAWRAARLQSMDFESRRTDDLMRLISGQQQQPTANVQQSPSPIPIQQ